MKKPSPDPEVLVSLPPAAAATFAECYPDRADAYRVASDPPGTQLGSGGGTIALLHHTWKESGSKERFEDWIEGSQKLIIHGSGASRRLPGYAPRGKPMMPLPLLPHTPGQHPDQMLLDRQAGFYRRCLWYAPSSYCLAVTCGDVLIEHAQPLPVFPEVDVLIFGLHADPEEAQHHGVMFCEKGHPEQLRCFAQKPRPDEIRERAKETDYYLDIGIWLLSPWAARVLLDRSGWNNKKQRFTNGPHPDNCELYAGFGPALGTAPLAPEASLSDLRCAVLPLQGARFYHFGTNRSILHSTQELMHPAAGRRSFGHGPDQPKTKALLIDSILDPAAAPHGHQVWIENSHIPASWKLTDRHVLTGIPDNDWNVHLPSGICLDIVPLTEQRICLRSYGFDDPFRGRCKDPETLWMGSPLHAWLADRGLSCKAAGIDPKADLQDAPLFPVLDANESIDPGLLRWLLSIMDRDGEEARERWLHSPRCSASDLLREADIPRQLSANAASESTWIEQQRRDPSLIDLQAAGRHLDTRPPPPALHDYLEGLSSAVDPMDRAHRALFRYQQKGQPGDRDLAFKAMRQAIVTRAEVPAAQPRRNLLEDQIVWGRSAIRLDLAGGWTDTPPYCLEHGGRVVNLAVELNGQPPIQVFCRLTKEPRVVIRSIDLGIDERIEDYAALADYRRLNSGFSVVKGALALAGLEPEFHAHGRYASLREQLQKEFGGGVEISMLAAIPKGSGLGTSSILAATLLGTLGEAFGLNWTREDLYQRTLALEQLLTSGGGWQDQVGGILPGIKLISTPPGLTQQPEIRWLPDGFFVGPGHVQRFLLYYTGITRVAADLLGEIVQAMLLNRADTLAILREIGWNAAAVADALQRECWDDLCEGVCRSWMLNQRLDPGTNPPQVQALLDPISDYLAAGKLLGAGGGGYLLMLPKDAEAARHIREHLGQHPPNARARFVEPTLSKTGLEISRS